MSWPRTLALMGVAAVMAFCAITAYRQYAAAQKAEAPLTPDQGSGLTAVVTNPGVESELIDYEFFTVSFNPLLHIPNWVSWELTAGETEGEETRTKFQADTRVEGCPTPKDYTGSGYDRGHMAPAADMKWNPEAMARCFLMTNMCPQSHTLNSGTWKKLEEKSRLWAKADSAIIIVCGPVLTPEPEEYIGESGVAVPKAFFKVICAPYANPPRAIGFIMPNGKVEGGLQAAAVSVDRVEELTGHDFFAPLPDEIENAIEAECRFHLWSTIKPKR